MLVRSLNLWEAVEPPIVFFRSPHRQQRIFAIFVTSSNGEEAMYYTLKDHQGSLAAVIHPDGDVERLSYDAWGRRRNPVGFGYGTAAEPVEATFDRGTLALRDLFGLLPFPRVAAGSGSRHC